MAEFLITAPDGKQYKVTGATREGALAALKKKLGTAPATPVNPDGTGVGRAIQRGAVQTAAALPTALATADLRALTDVNRSPEAIRYDEALRAGVPNQAFASRASDMSDPQQVNSMMQQYGVSPQANVNYQQVVEKRLDNREDAAQNPAEYLKRLSANSETAGRLFKLADSFERSPTADAYAQSLAEAPDSFMGWLGTVTDDPLGFMAFMGETIAESAPQIAAGAATTAVTGNPVAGASVMSLGGLGREYANEVNSFLSENGIDLSDPEAAKKLFANKDLMDKANERGLTRGLVIAAADFAGQGLVSQQIIRKSLKRQAVAQGASEASGEALATKAVGDEFSAKDTIIEGLAGTGSTVGEATVSRTLFNKDGKLVDPSGLPDTESQAAASLAQRIRTISNQNGYNLKDVGNTGDAKQALEAAHEQISGQIKEIVANPAVKKYLNPKQAATLDQLIDDYAAAQIAVRQSKNKVKSKVTQENFDAIMRLLPPTVEAQQIANLMREGNQLTDLFKNGTKGGISQFTDTFNPFTREDGSYDPSKVISGMANKGVAIATMGGSLPYQFGAVGAGRAIDAVTGRRSAVNRFVNKFENKDSLPDPVGPSLIAAERLKQEQDDARAAELGGLPQVDKDNSPIGTILSGTGLDRDGLKAAMTEIESAFPDVKALEDVFGDIRKNLDGGTNKIRNLNDIIPVINQHLNTPDTVVKRAAAPDQLLAQRGGVNIPNIDQTPAQDTPTPTAMSQSPQFGPQLTTPENYNRGIEANQTAAQTLSLQAQNDADLSVKYKAVIASALDKLQGNLGANPVMNAEAIMEAAVNAGVPQEAIDAYVKPYVDRVVRQQSRPTSAAPGLQAAREAGVAPTIETQAPIDPMVQTEAPVQPTLDPIGHKQADYTKAVDLVMNDQAVSASYVQRKLEIPYDEAADIVQRMEDEGLISAPNQVGAREILRQVPPRMAMAPQEDAPAVDPKRPQAPRLAPEQIPTQTRKVYKLMKVQKSRPGEVLPLFAKSGGDKGPASGYTLGEWFGAENQRPKLGNKLLAPRPGIHAVNLPVFDQGKAKVKGEQRVWVEVEIPAVSPETQAESDNSPVLSNGMRTGVQDRLITPNESYDYKTNPNASNDAGGWPVAGSMKALRIVPDAEIAQILRDNGLDHQVENSFSDVDEAKAQELMQPATPVRMAMAPEGEPQPIPRGETTNIQMPNQLGSAFEFAKGSNFSKGRDFKLALQEKALAAQKEEGIDLSTLTDENINRLADYVVADALVALQDNANAIGWYDRTVTDALSTLSEVYPEIQTNPKNKLQFIWALAVTSNGTKVDKNFELAATAYDHLQRTGRFPTNIGIGEAARAINGGLQQYHTMLEKFERKTNSDEGDHQLLADFMNSQVPVKQIEQEYGVKISGEGKNTLVRGASILGPKIGNGFFSNLYGNFDALTMDRWLMRTVGRHRGTLVKINQPMINQKTSEIKTMLKDASPETMKGLRRIFKPTGTKIGKNMTNEEVYVLAARIAKESTSADWRTELNGVSEDLRKAGNALAKYRDGQVEAPAGAKERDFIRAVFQQALERLNTEPSVTRASNTGLTMSDLQALLWYPEKRLYDSSKAPEGQESRGYADDEAPDYANAARKLVEARKGSPSGSGLGPDGPDGPGGGGASGPNARQSQPPVTDGVAGILASRLAGGSAQRSSVPSTQEVKQAAEPARAIIEVGKKGSKYEDGIKDINQVRELADAINVTIKMYSDQKRMRMDAGAPDATSALGLYEGGTAYSLTPSASRSEFQTYITTLHEVAHGLNDQRYSPGDMRTFSPEQQQQLMGTLAGYPPPMTNKLTGRKEQFRRASFDQYIGQMLAGQSGVPKDLQKKILKEMKDLQDKGKYRDGSDVRYIGGTKRPVSERKNTDYYKYVRSTPELAVDPVIYYLHDPKGMKKNYPVTAQAIQKFFRLSSKIQFYNHPLAMAVAVALAMLMKAKQEDEQEKQMPPGALNQPMPMGALSQA